MDKTGGFFKPTVSNYTDNLFNETADIVLGDAWLPEYTSGSQRNNNIIIRNSEIGNLIPKVIHENRLNLDMTDNETIFKTHDAHYYTHDELSYRFYKNNELRPPQKE